MWYKILFPIFFVGLILAEINPQNSILIKEARILESELAMAKGKTTYVLLDTGSGTLSLNAKGVTLQEWNIVKSRLWGFPFTLEPQSLVKKSAFLPPEREEINPGNSEQSDTFDIQALELSDMPESFSLVLEKGIRVYVTPSPKGMARVLQFTTKALRRLFFYPIETIISALHKENYHVLEIELESGTDVQALYWALQTDTSFLIFQQDE
ncbi:MAG: hypothetical protein ABIJ42_06725 [Acidobacteriota bacterium]